MMPFILKNILDWLSEQDEFFWTNQSKKEFLSLSSLISQYPRMVYLCWDSSHHIKQRFILLKRSIDDYDIYIDNQPIGLVNGEEDGNQIFLDTLGQADLQTRLNSPFLKKQLTKFLELHPEII